jgi:hypothetical protein
MVKIKTKVTRTGKALHPAPTDVPYYHATFRANASSILTEGLRVDAPRLWKNYARWREEINDVAGGKRNPYYDYVYLMDVPEMSALWVISYLSTDTESKRDSFGKEYRDFRKVEPDGITVFEIDPTGLEVMEGFIGDFVIRGGVPPKNLKIYGVIDPWEVWKLAELNYMFKNRTYYGKTFLGSDFGNRSISPSDMMEIMLDKIRYRLNRG